MNDQSTALVKLTLGEKFRALRAEEQRLLEEIIEAFPQESTRFERPRLDQLELDLLDETYVILTIDCSEDGYNRFEAEISDSEARLRNLGIDQVSVIAGTDDYFLKD
jgi:hypothetical protein